MISVPDKMARKVHYYQAIKCKPTNPSSQEIALQMSITVKEVEHLEKIRLGILSLQALAGSETDELLSETLADKNQCSPDMDYEVQSLHEVFKEALGTLSPREQQIIELRFGLNGNESHVLWEIGVMLKISRERIRQIVEKTLEKLSRNETIMQYRQMT